MKALLLSVLLCALSFGAVAAPAQTTVLGTKVLDGTGALLSSGQFCVGATCFSVTNGGIAPGSSIPSAVTATITITKAGVTQLNVPAVTVSGSSFSWDSFVLPSNTTALGLGYPRISCMPGAGYTQLDVAAIWNCASVNGAAVWQIGIANGNQLPSGPLPLSGGQMSGSLLLSRDPSQSMEAATKHYVDNQVAAAGGGGSGPPLSGSGTTALSVIGSYASGDALVFDGAHNGEDAGGPPCLLSLCTFSVFPQLPAGTPTGLQAVSAQYLANALATVTVSVDYAAGYGSPGYIANKPTLGTAAAHAQEDFDARGAADAAKAAALAAFPVVPVSTSAVTGQCFVGYSGVTGQFVKGTCGSSGTTPADPAFSPGFNSYASGISVTITNATQYCVSTTNVSCTPNTPYSGTIAVSSSVAMCAVGASGNTICGSYVIGASGVPDSSITNIASPPIAQGYFSDTSHPFKQLYWGNNGAGGADVCGDPTQINPSTGLKYSGCGVSGYPYGTPVMEFGLATPNASGQPGYFGKPNSVAHYKFQSSTNGSEVSVLWTPKGGGLQAQSAATNFYHDFWVMVKQGPATGDFQLEHDISAVDSGQKWMMGTQCDRGTGLLGTDGQNGWKYNGPHCTTAPHNLYDGKWHHLQYTYHRELKGQATGACLAAGEATYWWDNVIMDGVTYPMNYSACSVPSTWSQTITQWQTGGPSPGASTSTPTTYEIYVDSDFLEVGLAASTAPPGGGGNTGGDLGSFNFDDSTAVPSGLTTIGSPTIVSTPTPNSTPNAAHFPSGLNYFVDTINPSTKTIYTGQSIYLESTNNTLPDAFLRFYNTNAMLFGYYFSTTAYLSFTNSATATQGTAGQSAYPTGSWHCVETYTKFDATAGHITVWFDNTQVYDSGTGTLNTGTTAPNAIWFGNIGNTAPTGWVTDQDNVNWDDTARPGCS